MPSKMNSSKEQRDADKAQRAADKAQQEADKAQEAADAAREEENNGNTANAQKHAKEADKAAEKAEKANQEAGGESVEKDTQSGKGSPAQQAQEAADRAQQSADNAQAAANAAQESVNQKLQQQQSQQQSGNQSSNNIPLSKKQQAADDAQAAADAAQAAADKAQQAANEAKQAAKQAAKAERSGDNKGAQNSANEAKNAAEQAESLNQTAGGESVDQSNIDSTDSPAEQAMQAANNAQKSADNAQAAADAAQAAADAAQAAADVESNTNQSEERKTANAAQAAADAAKKSAQRAQAAADEAQKNAKDARESEDSGDMKAAQNAADNAIDNAMTADNANIAAGGESVDQSNIDPSSSPAEQAQAAADNAQQSADNAKQAADDAQKIADEAKEAADAADAAKRDNGGNGASNNDSKISEKRKAANRAQSAAEQAEQAAQAAQAAANQAAEAEKEGDDEKLKEALNKAKEALEDALSANKDAGGKSVQDVDTKNMSDSDKAQTMANQARDAAKNAQNAADRAAEEADKEDTESTTTDSHEPGVGFSDFEEGEAFGIFIADLIYQNNGNAKDVLDTFRKTMVLPDVPDMKLIDSAVFTELESFNNYTTGHKIYEADDELLKALIDAIEAGGSTDKVLSNIMNTISTRGITPEKFKKKEYDIPEDRPEAELPPEMQHDPKRPPTDNTKGQKVKIVMADGKYTGLDSFNSGNHVITREEENEIMQSRRDHRAKLAKKLGRTNLSDLEKDPFNGLDGQFNLIDSVCKRSFGRGVKIEGLTDEEIAERKKHLPTDVKGRIAAAHKPMVDWKRLLKSFLHGATTKVRTTMTANTVGKLALHRDTKVQWNVEKETEVGNKIVVFLDTSYSVFGTTGKINQIIAEITAIAKQKVHTKHGMVPYFQTMDIVLFNDDVDLKNSIFNASTSAAAKIKGLKVSTGGTELQPVYQFMFDYYSRDKRVSAMLMITDSDLCVTDNRFAYWAKKHPVEGREVSKLGKKFLLFAFYDGRAGIADYRYSTLPNAKVSVLAKESMINESKDMNINSNNISESMKKEYFVINEAGFIKRKATTGTNIPKPSSPANPNPAASTSSDGPVDLSADIEVPQDKETLSKIASELRTQTIADAAREGSHVYSGAIHDWIKNVFNWRLKQVNSAQETFTLPQTYYVNEKNKIIINNETYEFQGSHKSEVNKMKASHNDWTSPDSKYDSLVPADEKQPNGEILSKVPKKGLRPPYSDADIEIISYRGNLEINGYTGDTLPKFVPKRFLRGSATDTGGNFKVINCPNLNNFDNFPRDIEGTVRIIGCPKLKDKALLNKYIEEVEDVDAQKASQGISVITKNKIRCI